MPPLLHQCHGSTDFEGFHSNESKRQIITKNNHEGKMMQLSENLSSVHFSMAKT